MYDGNDRVQQVNALRQLAEDIVQSLPAPELSAHSITRELVDWCLDETDPHADPLPTWLDNHDRNLLVRMIRHSLREEEPSP